MRMRGSSSSAQSSMPNSANSHSSTENRQRQQERTERHESQSQREQPNEPVRTSAAHHERWCTNLANWSPSPQARLASQTASSLSPLDRRAAPDNPSQAGWRCVATHASAYRELRGVPQRIGEASFASMRNRSGSRGRLAAQPNLAARARSPEWRNRRDRPREAAESEGQREERAV